MTTLDTEDRNRLKDSSFAWIDDKGERHLPINDEAHVRNAIARFNQTEFDEPGAKVGGRAQDPRGSEGTQHRCRQERRRREGLEALDRLSKDTQKGPG